MGQNSLLPLHSNPANGVHPFNIPKVDFGVGPDTTLSPIDPRTINDSVCQWLSTFLGCTGSGLVNYTLQNVDLCGTKIGQPAVTLFVGGGSVTPGSLFTAKNNYFCLIPGVGSPFGVSGNYNFKIWNNKFDGSAANSSSGTPIDVGVDAAGSYVDMRYNDFVNVGVARVINGQTNSALIFRDNAVDGLNSLNTNIHGELMLRNCSGARANCTAYDDYDDNFIIYPAGAVSGVDNATVFPGDGASDGVVLSSFDFNRNVVVTNSATGGNAPLNQAMFNSRLSSLGVTNMNDNDIDASGSDDCSINGVKAGGNSVTASQSGTVITITGLSGSFGNNPIEKNWQFWRGGAKVATITSMGTSGGNTGTVNVDTSATIPSDSLWTLVPGFTSFTANNNKGLADPSHTGVQVALGLSGPQFSATHCPPHY